MMLSACKAIVIGRTEAQTQSLLAVARRVGFAIVEAPATGDIPTPRALISFVLVHHHVGDEVLVSVVQAIRGGGKDVRFSPIIVVANDCGFEEILRFTHMGVDDVVSLPEKREVLEQRLAQQLSSELIYIETSDYFGPDRRRFESAGDERCVGLPGHARYHIRRLPDVGTVVVHHKIFPGPQFAPPLHRAG